jgi:uroporphyrinogen-III synthase
MPEAAPVISAVLPSSRISILPRCHGYRRIVAEPAARERRRLRRAGRPAIVGRQQRENRMDAAGGDGALRGRRIALPETREAERLAQMLAAHGAAVVRCPLVAIVDLADPAPLDAWLRRFTDRPCDDLVLLTGEGLRRLAARAGAIGQEPEFRAALARTRTITRGPKPAAALRVLGLQPGLRAAVPTTDGIIAALAGDALRGRRVGVQLYPGADDRIALFLADAGADPDPITPYAYTSNAEDDRIAALIDEMAAGGVDAIAFTSSPQVKRLFDVAAATGRGVAVRAGLAATLVAAVGPVVADALQRRGVTAAVQPDEAFFMKPLVSALVAALGR